MPKARVLAIDDEPEVLRMLTEFLESSGYDVTGAKSVEEALAAMKSKPPDAILLDIAMPVIDGAVALRLLRAINPDVPVVMVTGNIDLDVARKTLQDGAFDYVGKPFALNYLGDVVATAVRYRRGFD